MQVNDIIKQVVKSSIYRAEVGSNYQIGFPMFEVNQNMLCITFFPHIEKNGTDKTIDYYLPQYKITSRQPYNHIIQFVNLGYYKNIDVSKPFCSIAKESIIQNKDSIIALYNKANELINAALSKTNTIILFKEYNELFATVTEALGMSGLYSGVN